MSGEKRFHRVLLVCIGNPLVGDDAVACHIHDRLNGLNLDGVRLVNLETSGIRLLDVLEGEPLLIVVDAMNTSAPPGTVHLLNWSELPNPTGAPLTSHDIGIREAIEICRRIQPEKSPQAVFLVGVEGRVFDQFCGMSTEVEAAIPNAIEQIRRLIAEKSDQRT